MLAVLGSNKKELNIAASNVVTDEMIPDFNVLHLHVKYQIVHNLDGALVVT
jgi:hypothetical protein